MEPGMLSLSKIEELPRNAKAHDLGAIHQSYDRFSFIERLIINNTTGHLIAGHGRLHALKQRKQSGKEAPEGIDVQGDDWLVPVDYVNISAGKEEAAAIALNRSSELGGWDDQILAEVLADLAADDLLDGTGFDGDDLDALLAELGDDMLGVGEDPGIEARQTLAERFIVPPFSVLDARQGYWQTRKRAWIALGIQSELGRGVALTWQGDTLRDMDYYRKRNRASPGGSLRPAASLGPDGKTQRGDGRGRTLGAIASNEKGANGILASPGKYAVGTRTAAVVYGSGDPGTLSKGYRIKGKSAPPTGEYDYPVDALQSASGTSIFDPVLCELAYRWFCPPGGCVLDPFAGGSVRGIVAAVLGRKYTGIDLRPEQVAANGAQAGEIVLDSSPEWIVGDSRNLDELVGGQFDFVFTCPPYFDLEIYSDDGRDLSNAEDYTSFMEDYRAIVAASVALLREDRFACVVVGDIRDKKGLYRRFVSDTIGAFCDAGMALYNDAVLVTALGSLPIRVGAQFGSSRKLGKTHQNVLVFVKGDPRKATEDIGPVESGPPSVIAEVG